MVISKGENLSMAPKDGRLDPLPTSQEKSPLLDKKSEGVNISKAENLRITHFTTSLLENEKIDIIKFFIQG